MYRILINDRFGVHIFGEYPTIEKAYGLLLVCRIEEIRMIAKGIPCATFTIG